jgi:preprotein translocase subunit SecB
MEFRLTHTFVHNLRLDNCGDSLVAEELRYSPIYREDRDQEFAVIFDLVQPLKPDSVLKMQFITVFQTSAVMDEVFRNSHFPRVNAPAVGYPYLRAFVSQFAVLAGCEPFTMPIRNFVKEAAATNPAAALRLPKSTD